MRGPDAETPDAVAPPPGHPRFPLVDGLRAVAAISVLLVHTAQFSGALTGTWYRGLLAHLDLGVTLFFLITGFLLYRPFVAARVLGTPRARTGDYARRRFLRIAPAYWFALTALAIFPGVYGVFSGQWWVYYGLLQNYPVYEVAGPCATEPSRCAINPAWSLGIEVGFYAVLPLFALATDRAFRRLRGSGWLTAELGVLAVLGAVSVPVVLRLGSDLERVLWFSPLGHAWWFGLGMALAALSVRSEQRGAGRGALPWGDRAWVPWTGALGLYLVLSLAVLDPIPGKALPDGQYVAEYLLFGVIAALLLLPAVVGDGARGAPRRLLASRPVAWLGLVSYGLFLWHWPIMYALYRGGIDDWWPAMAFPVLTLATFAIALACASMSYYAIERPLMRFKVRRSPPREAALASPGPGG